MAMVLALEELIGLGGVGIGLGLGQRFGRALEAVEVIKGEPAGLAVEECVTAGMARIESEMGEDAGVGVVGEVLGSRGIADESAEKGQEGRQDGDVEVAVTPRSRETFRPPGHPGLHFPGPASFRGAVHT